MPNVQDLDVTVLAFAQWLSEMRSRSNSSLQQMLAEMGIIRNGITSNNTDLTEFKRNTATVQQQMQSQITDIRDKLTDAYTEIANLKKTKSGFEQEVHAEYQSLSEQLQFKTLELETLKKAYAHTHQQLQQQIIGLQSEVNELRLKGDDATRQSHLTYEQNINKVSEVEMATQYADNEMKRLRSDHDQAISNLAENMNRWNDTLRDLSKEFHDFQKVMNVNHQRVQSSLWDVQAKTGIAPSPGLDSVGLRMESEGKVVSPPGARQAPAITQGPVAPAGAPQGAAIRAQSPVAAAAAASGQRRTNPQPQQALASPYPAGPPPGQASYMMR
jgi:predicted  nucleic acid-binding Zn-ribbon protein